jgi:purine-nucleoside phosphorylase
MENHAVRRDEYMARIREAVDAIRAHTQLEARVGIVMGTGLGGLAGEVEVDSVLPYEEIPHFPLSTLETHPGRLILGQLDGTPVVAMQGRFHRYEGYSLQEVTFPIRVLRMLGAEVLVVSGISGGMNPAWRAGDLVLLDDHINLLGDNPLVGDNLDELGPRFPDMSEPYDRGLQTMAKKAAEAAGLELKQGVYVALTGPNPETRAEYRMLRGMGADIVGMSTVPEVIVARQMEMRVLGLSIVTDECFPDTLKPVDVPAIIATAMNTEPKLTALIRAVVSQL